jgi:hypothetical protein
MSYSDSEREEDESSYGRFTDESSSFRLTQSKKRNAEEITVREEEVEFDDEDRFFSCRLENIKFLVELLASLSLDTVTHKDFECFIEATPECEFFFFLPTLSYW